MKNLLGFGTAILSMFLSVAVVLGTQSAFAGGGGTGGGGTHVCYDEKGQIKSVELFDLYEARETLGYKLVDPADKTTKELLNDALNKINRASFAFTDKIVRYLRTYSSTIRLAKNKEFEVIKDARIVFVDKNCEYRQIAQWKAGAQFKTREGYIDSTVFINAELINVFRRSNLNIAALALHEAIYAFQREEEGEQYSDRARAIVAKAFSDEPLTKYDLEMRNYRISPIYSPESNDKISIRLTAIKNDPSYIFILSNGNNKCEIEAVGDSCEFNLNDTNIYYRFFHNIEDEKATIKIEILKNGKPFPMITGQGSIKPWQDIVTFGNGTIKEGQYYVYRQNRTNENPRAEDFVRDLKL